jgi:hypothetical protein
MLPHHFAGEAVAHLSVQITVLGQQSKMAVHKDLLRRVERSRVRLIEMVA